MYSVFQRLAETQFAGEDIRRSCRKYTQGHIRPDHSVDYFVDRAVASGDQNQIGAALDCPPHQFCSGPRPGRRHCIDCNPKRCQQINGAMERTLLSLESAGERIVNEKGFAVGLDSNLSIVNGQRR